MTAPAELRAPRLARQPLGLGGCASRTRPVFHHRVLGGWARELSQSRPRRGPLVRDQDDGHQRRPGPAPPPRRCRTRSPTSSRSSLQELELFDYVKTYTRPGVTVIQVQLKDTARQNEVDDAWYQVRKKLNDSRPTLPQGVQGPFFNDEYGDVYSAIYMLSGADVSLAKLKDYAEIVRQRLLRTEGVAKVDIVGVPRSTHLHRVQPPQAGHARYHAPDHFRQRGAPERRDGRRHR